MMLGSSATRHQPSFTISPVRDASAAVQSCPQTAASAALRMLAALVLVLLTCSSASAQASNNNLFGGGPRHLCILLFNMIAHASRSRDTQIIALAGGGLPGLVSAGRCGMCMPSHVCQNSSWIGDPWPFRPPALPAMPMPRVCRICCQGVGS